MLIRAITGFLFTLTIIVGVYFNAQIALALFSLIVFFGVREFYGLVKSENTIRPLKNWGVFTSVSSIILVGLILLDHIEPKHLFLIIPFFFSVFLIELYRNKSNPFVNIAYTLLGVSYILIPFSMLFHLGFYKHGVFSDQYSYQLILGFFILLWTNDTGAYFSGRFFGKHKLFERISPKKTWEGTIGGGLLTLASAYFTSLYFTNIDSIHWIVIAVLVVVFGGLGDLVESMLKRSLNIKDSGNILPGHGGILDRFDGLLLSVPFVYTYLQLIS